MDSRIPGAIGAAVILVAGGWLAVKGLETAWTGSRQETAVLYPVFNEEEFVEEPPALPEPKKPEPANATPAVVAANTPKGDAAGRFNGGILGKGGTVYWVNGDRVFGSDGSSAQRVGPVTYAQQPDGRIERYETFGDTTYGPNGIAAQRSGSTTYVTSPDGRITTCTTIGNVTNC